MAAGDIIKEALLVVEKFTVKTNEDIELGEIVCDDGSGNGIVAATAALIRAGNKAMMAREAHDYSEVSTHEIPCVVVGCVEAQKITGSGAAKRGQKLEVSGTSGEVQKLVKGDLPDGGVSTYYTAAIETAAQAAVDKNLGNIGIAYEDSENADTTQKMWLGV